MFVFYHFFLYKYWIMSLQRSQQIETIIPHMWSNQPWSHETIMSYFHWQRSRHINIQWKWSHTAKSPSTATTQKKNFHVTKHYMKRLHDTTTTYSHLMKTIMPYFHWQRSRHINIQWKWSHTAKSSSTATTQKKLSCNETLHETIIWYDHDIFTFNENDYNIFAWNAISI